MLYRQASLALQFLTPKDQQNDEYGQLHASGIHCTGRIVLNVWRILRSELKLNIYTFESCVAAVLQLRTPHVQPQVLTHWFNSGPAGLPLPQAPELPCPSPVHLDPSGPEPLLCYTVSRV